MRQGAGEGGELREITKAIEAHDRLGGGNSSWNAVHLTGRCSQSDVVATGGAGLLYCLAAD